MRCAGLLCVLAVTVGCKSSGDDYGVIPGTGGPGGGGDDMQGSGNGNDGGVKPDALVMGRVCVMGDPRDKASCATSGADGITVKLGNYTTTTATDGAFAVQSTGGTNLVWHVSGPTIVTSVIPYSANTTLPAIATDKYTQMLSDNGVIFVDQEAALFARVTQGGAVAVGAIASASPAPTSAIFYDDANATLWNQNKTGAFGVVWIPNLSIAAGTSETLTVTPADHGSGQTATPFPGIPLENLSITFVAVDAP